MRQMRVHAWRWVAVLACGLGTSLTWAEGKPVIPWMVINLPPTSVPVNGQLTDGYLDTMIKMVFAEMPEAEHRIVETSFARAWVSLTEGEPQCVTSALMTPDREPLAYITPMRITPPLQVVARADVVSRIPVNGKGEVLPGVLFDRPDLHGLITPKRSYSAAIDALLAARSPQSGIREAVAAGAGSNQLEMLSLARADYTLDYDYVLAYQFRRHPETLNGIKLKALPIAGMQPMFAGIACPHTEWGRQMILRLDAIVAKISQTPQYQAALDRWFTPDSEKRYHKAKQDFLRRRSALTDPAKFPVWPPAK